MDGVTSLWFSWREFLFSLSQLIGLFARLLVCSGVPGVKRRAFPMIPRSCAANIKAAFHENWWGGYSSAGLLMERQIGLK